MSLSNSSPIPRTRRSGWLSGAALIAGLAITPGAAFAQEAAPAQIASAAKDQPSFIIVTARFRDEDFQDVPIPISVLSGDLLAQQRVFTIADLTQRAPGLTATSPNARRTGVSLRGIGKTSGIDNMEAAVGTIVDDVFVGHVGMTTRTSPISIRWKSCADRRALCSARTLRSA